MGVKAGAEQPLQSAGPTLLLVNKIGSVCFYDSSAMCVCERGRQRERERTRELERETGKRAKKKKKSSLFTTNTSSITKQISLDLHVYEHASNAFNKIFHTPVQCSLSPVFTALLPVHLSLESRQPDKSVPNNMHRSPWKQH